MQTNDTAIVSTLGEDGQPQIVDLAKLTETDVPRETEPKEEVKTEVKDEPKVDKPWKDKTEAERIEHGMQKRIDKLTARLHEREEVIKSLQEQYRPPVVEPVKPAQPVTEDKGSRPVPQAGEDPVDYLERLADWKIEQKTATERQNQARQTQEAKDAELLRSWQTRVNEAHAKYDDFDEVTNSEDVKLAPFMARAIMESDVGTDIAYYLGNNPKEAARIAELSPTAQAREIGRLEARLTEQGGGRKVSSAPEPIEPIGDKGHTGRVEKTKTLDDPNLSDAEWRALRDAQLRERRRR